MPGFIDTNSSINQMLEMLKHYRTDGKNKDNSELHFDSKFNSRQVEDMNSSMNFFSKGYEPPVAKLQLHSSLEKKCDKKQQISTVRERQESGVKANPTKNIFTRLYDENKAMQQRRERLLQQGRKSIEQKQRKTCTFSPQTCLKSRTKTQKPLQELEIEYFYQKNIDWQKRKQREIKEKQCEKNNESLNNLTFTPRINAFKKRDVSNKQNSNNLMKKKGVEQFLQRQKDAKVAQKLLQDRKKKPYSHIWNLKKGCFSQIN